METNFYNDDFEQLLKEKSDEFRMYPSKRVWHSIYNDLHPGRKWPSVAVSMLLITALFMAGYWNSNYSSPAAKTSIAATIQKNITAPENTDSKNNTSSATSDLDQNISSSSSFANVGVLQPKVNTKNVAAAVRSNNLETNFSATANNSGIENVFTENQSSTHNNETFELLINTKGLINKPEENEIASLPENSDEAIIAHADNLLKNSNNDFITTIVTNPVIDKENTEDGNAETKSLKANSFTAKQLSTEDKAWMENYALHNKSMYKKWKERSTATFFITPNVGYRKLYNDPKYNVAPTPSSFAMASSGTNANQSVNQKPGLGLEAGFNFNYALAKNIRFTAGLQANYTSYAAMAIETNHPVSTTLMLIDPATGNPYLYNTSATLANADGFKTKKIHNKTYQVALPVGLALKLYGNDKLEWFAGAAIQPTFVPGGKAYLISADRKNYVADAAAIRKWNLNTGFETYINYKFDGFTLQAGPQFRYQLLSTYDKKYTVKENLYNMGVKVGVVKSF